MKIELYNVKDEEGKRIRDFLIRNNLPFKEIITNDSDILKGVAQLSINKPISLLKVTKNHSINIIHGYLEWDLNQLLEHIKKYNPKIET